VNQSLALTTLIKNLGRHNHPPTYSHSTNPLDADDWLKTVTKKLETAQCNDREMVLYAAGRLEGLAADWWDAYNVAIGLENKRMELGE
jgi:hypothetical protein